MDLSISDTEEFPEKKTRISIPAPSPQAARQLFRTQTSSFEQEITHVMSTHSKTFELEPRKPKKLRSLELNYLVFNGEVSRIKYLCKHKPKNWDSVINEKDSKGNTSLMLAVKLVTKSTSYLKVVKLLLKNSADHTVKDNSGWSLMDEAVSQKNPKLISILFDHMHTQKMLKWSKHKDRLKRMLSSMKNFYLEFNWEFKSSVIPLVGKFTPSDRCKLYKVGKALRLDYTLVGWKRLKSKRRDMSLLFKSSQVTLVNHSKKSLVNPLEEIDSEERMLVISDFLKSSPVHGEFDLVSFECHPCLNWRGKPITQRIGVWNTQKYKVHFKTQMLYKKKTFHKPIPEDYFSNEHLEQPEEVKNVLKSSKATIWTTNEFCFSLRRFLPLLGIMSTSNPSTKKLYDFLSSENLLKVIPQDSFPVKIDIPLSMSIRAVVSFENFQKLQSFDKSLVQLPNYAFLPRKVAQKTLVCPKKRLFLANIVT